MKRTTLFAAAMAVASATALAPTAAAVASAGASAEAAPAGAHSHRVCTDAKPERASCHALVLDATAGQQAAAAGAPSGYGPADLQAAYKLAGKQSGARTVAIVDAYDDPTAEQDLAVYRSRFGLAACTTANGCFHKVNQYGTNDYPAVNASWAEEISLDVDMVSAICPDCHILLVEANSNSFANLGHAVDYAASVPGVIAISNSYGGSDRASSSHFDHPGIAITASTGDNGYGVEAPASFEHVVAVGGTSLHRAAATTRGWTESAWSGAGSGCSTKNQNPGWQTGTSCSGKANADVSAVADPNTGVAVYDSTPFQGYRGWLVFGGTSAASPIVASVYALAHNFGTNAGSYTWAHRGRLYDVRSGYNGGCSTASWCHARKGWDGPTGLGTPHGIGGF